MAIIDLTTGKATGQPTEGVDSFPVQPIQGRVIDLNTGAVVQPVQLQQAPQAEPARPLSELVPEAISAVPTEVPEIGIGDFITGSERIAATPELGELKEFGDTPESGRMSIALGLATTFDQKAQQDIIQTAIPEAVFETTPDGSVIIEVPTEDGGTRRSVLNRPGFSQADAMTAIAQVISFIPAAKVASLGRSLAQKIGFGALASGATEQALQETGVELGREERDPVATAIATATGGLAEAVVPAIQAFRGARQAAKTGVAKEEVAKAVESIRPTTEAVEGLEQATGQKVGLFRAQQTQVPSELSKQRILPQLDAGSKVAAEALEIQNKEVFEATTRLINTIAPEGSIVGASSKFRDASRNSITAAIKSRSEAVRPLYDEAFKKARIGGDSVDLKPVIEMANKELKTLVNDDPAAIAINSFLGRLKGEKIAPKKAGLIVDSSGSPIIAETKEAVKPLSLDKLQSAKLTTDAAIDKAGGLTLNSAQKNAKRVLTQLEQVYVGQLGKLSPEFAAANKEFARLSGPIGDLQDSIIGQVAKVNDTQLKNIAQTIFDPKSGLTDPSAIIKAKKVINSVNPDAWNDLLRVEMNRRIGGLESLIDDIPGDFAGNIPGQLTRTLFGNPQQRKALLSGMNKKQKENFKYLETVLKRASSGRAQGSPTAAFGQAIERLKGVGGVIRDAIFKPLTTLQQTGERGIFDKNVANLTRVMFDPKFAPRVAKLKLLDSNTPAAARALTQLLDDAARTSDLPEENSGN